MALDIRDKTFLILGDSLSHRGDRAAPDGVPAVAALRSGSPGDLLASHLLAAGAAHGRVNGRVSRSAVNLFAGTNGERGGDVLAAEAAYQPQVVIVALGTNDLGLASAADAAAFRRIVNSFPPGTEFWALGPPAFARADLTAKADAVYATLHGVFGGNRVVDWRPLTADILTTTQGRAGDGIHFATAGAAKAAARAATALLSPVEATTAITVRWLPWTTGAVVGAAVIVGLALVIRRRRLLAA